MTASLPPAFPDQGLTDDVILGTLAALRELDVPVKGGRTTSYVYDPDRDDLEDLSLRAFALSEHVNGLDPTAFPSFAAVENDLVAAALSVLGSGDPGEVGTMTSGGTESCALAVLGARERWRAKVGDPHGHPTLVAPASVHPAFVKACHLFDVELVSVPIDPVTFAADVEAHGRGDRRADRAGGRLGAVLRPRDRRPDRADRRGRGRNATSSATSMPASAAGRSRSSARPRGCPRSG